MTPIQFARSESAAVSVEAVIAMPLLLWLYLMTYIWWDGYRSAMVAQKSSFTISDIISREPTTIDQGYIDGLNTFFGELTIESATSLRVSVVEATLAANGTDTELQLNWSRVTGTEFTCRTDMDGLTERIPMLDIGDEMIVVETHSVWDPLVTFAIIPQDAYAFITTSPRFGVPQVLWGGGDCTNPAATT